MCVYSKGFKSLSKKVVGIIEGLRHHCYLPPDKANVVVDALSRMRMGILSNV